MINITVQDKVANKCGALTTFTCDACDTLLTEPKELITTAETNKCKNQQVQEETLLFSTCFAQVGLKLYDKTSCFHLCS